MLEEEAPAASEQEAVDLRPLLERARAYYLAQEYANSEQTCRFILDSFADQPDALNFLALSYNSLGQPEKAIRCFERLTQTDPANARGHYNLGNLYMELRQPVKAASCFREALRYQPAHLPALRKLGDCQLQLGMKKDAFATVWKLLEHEPRSMEHWKTLSKTMIRDDRIEENPEFVLFLRRSIENQETPKQVVLHAVMLYFLRSNSAIYKLCVLAGEDVPRLEEMARTGQLFQLLRNSLFMMLLRMAPVASIEIERLMTFVRRQLLAMALATDASALINEDNLRILAVLAAHCQITDLAYYVTQEEERQVALLAEMLAKRQPDVSSLSYCWMLMALSCYRPLQHEPYAQAVAAHAGQAINAVRSVIVEFIGAPLVRSAIGREISQLTEINNAVSQAVQEQYEENPYPCWRELSATDCSPMADWVALFSPEFDVARLDIDHEPRVLIAGCGTGQQALVAARRYKDCSVLAVDLSLTSLAYAEWMRRSLYIENALFLQADILEMGALEEQFDVIECGGVLHHMADPVAGWAVLTGRLKTGGLMKVGLYSQRARRDITRVRQNIAAEGYGESPAEIRRFRHAIMESADPYGQYFFTQHRDFYSISECRDLLFHRQEHQFTIPQIAEIIQRLGLEFMGFERETPELQQLYRSRFPRDTAMISLENWHMLEQENPGLFAVMYQFWLYKP